MMCSRVVLVDLPEDGSRVMDCIRLPAKQAARHTPYLLGKGELRSRKNTNRCAGIFRRSEPTSAGIEVVGGQFIADLCRTRLNIMQAVVAHAEDLLFCPQPQPTKVKSCARGLMVPTGAAIRPWPSGKIKARRTP